MEVGAGTGDTREPFAEDGPSRVRVEDDGTHDDDVDGAGSEEDFEFVLPGSCSDDGSEALTADDIFANGLIRRVYPLFDQGLVFDGTDSSRSFGDSGSSHEKEREPLYLQFQELTVDDSDPPSSSSWESRDREELPSGSYCEWTPRSTPGSPDLRRKSRSAGGGSSSRRWRLLGLVMGRSHSDGKERLVFLQDHSTRACQQQKKEPVVAGTKKTEKKVREKGSGSGKSVEMDMVTAHRLFYGKHTGATAGDHRRRYFLPYRRDLLGFFGNVNSRGFHPS